MTCVVQERQRARVAGEALAAHPAVLEDSTGLIAPDTAPRRTWIVQFVVDADRHSDAVPSGVLGILHEHGLDLVAAERRGEPVHRVVTAEVPR